MPSWLFLHIPYPEAQHKKKKKDTYLLLCLINRNPHLNSNKENQHQDILNPKMEISIHSLTYI
jgi:hypothetical protein